MGGKPIWGTLAQSGRSDGVRRTLWAERGVCWVGGGGGPWAAKGLGRLQNRTGHWCGGAAEGWGRATGAFGERCRDQVAWVMVRV